MTIAVETRESYPRASQTIIGESLAIRRLRATIEAMSRTQLAVLLEGPTGAGKELVAAAIHAHSGRRGALVAFNVCAIGESMFEDALFGHVRGAFTGAVHDSAGFLREADCGTVFLDEIGGLSIALQAKLLRAIELGVFRPVGASRDARSDFRLVAATNERLVRLVDSGRFRSDFAHRIGAATIVVPSLLERLDDIPLLVEHFLRQIGADHMTIDEGVMDRLKAYDWPGNVRELKQVVEWSAAYCSSRFDLHAVTAALEQRALHGTIRSDDFDFQRKTLRLALDSRQWNVGLAAQDLGVHRATLYRRMKRMGLSAAAMRTI